MKVMIVDDSSFVQLVCKQTLEKSGYQVVAEAYDGVEAVEKAEQAQPDIILMDIALPKRNGLEATEMILSHLPNTQILAISAIDEDWIKDKVMQAGCFAFLSKPFETKDLLSLLDQVQISDGNLKYG